MSFSSRFTLASFAMGMLIAVAMGAAPALAQLSNPCDQTTIQNAAPEGMTVSSAADVAASGSLPEYCDVQGSVETVGFGAPHGSAGFREDLPANWNHKFLYLGCGGTCGSVGNPAAGGTGAQALAEGFAVIDTNDGHSNSNPTWGYTPNPSDPSLPGTPNEAALVDFFFRSEHEVAVAGKALAENYFSGDIDRSYFSGCSDGGREGLVEAYRFPHDYDGIVVGDPYQTQRDELLHVDAYAAFNKPANPGLPIPDALLSLVDQAVLQECDGIDGEVDGLIQDPLRCNFDPQSLLCSTGQTSDCLTQAQVNAIKTYLSPLVDQEGQMVLPGWPVSDILPPPTEPFSFTVVYDLPNVFFISAQVLIQEVYFTSSFNANNYPILNGVINDQALAKFDAATWAASNVNPRNLTAYLANPDHKLLMYDGFSDQGLPPYQTVMFYEDLSKIRVASRNNVRLFMVPGMEHCGGGPGPNVFDTLTPIQNWVENGAAPDSIIATHYTDDTPSMGVDRTMPLCPFPEQAQYDGSGNIDDAANWSCPNQDKTLLDLGTDGVLAGFKLDRDLLQSQFFVPRESHGHGFHHR